MEILTLLKANIRHKKGTFVSIILLMIIISMSMTAILSVQDNCTAGIENALEQVDAGDMTVYIKSEALTDKLLNSVKNHDIVERVKTNKAIKSDRAEANGKTDSNSWFLRELRDEYKIFNGYMSAYEEKTPALKRGEIYVPQGVMTKLGCNVGDTIKITTIGGEYNFKIKGIVAEPVNGAFTIGWKQVFISNEDFDKIYESVKANETDEKNADFTILQLYKSPDCILSDSQFKRQLNLDTEITDYASATGDREESIYYTNLLNDIIIKMLMVFIGLLIVIELIVIQHSISTGIEMDYVNLGVLKSQGFTKGKIRAVFVLQYMIAELIGSVVGIILSIPLTKALGDVFQPITALLAEDNISVAKSLMVVLAVILISGLFISFLTRKVGKISPVRAISGAKNEIYFDSRIKAPICRTGLSSSLAMRQFTSNKRRYLGTILIVSLLVFFMMTINILGNALNSKSALESMGSILAECEVSFKEKVDDKTLKEMEETVERYSAIEKKYYLSTVYFSINGEERVCQIYKNTDALETFVTKGRSPLYNNEIVITEILADDLGLKMGDEVTISNNGTKSKYVISGIFVSMSDAGRTFAMSMDGAEKLGVDIVHYVGYSLSNPEMNDKIAHALNVRFGNVLEASESDVDSYLDIYTIALNAMKAVIYSFSIIFTLVVVIMVCSKMFMQEKTDIGIFKALGFTSQNLRMQFAVRFLIVSILGSALGSLLCVLLSGRLLSSVFRLVGITSFAVEYTASTFIVPICIICACFFIFAYMTARRIKSVEVRELVVE